MRALSTWWYQTCHTNLENAKAWQQLCAQTIVCWLLSLELVNISKTILPFLTVPTVKSFLQNFWTTVCGWSEYMKTGSLLTYLLQAQLFDMDTRSRYQRLKCQLCALSRSNYVCFFFKNAIVYTSLHTYQRVCTGLYHTNPACFDCNAAEPQICSPTQVIWPIERSWITNFLSPLASPFCFTQNIPLGMRFGGWGQGQGWGVWIEVLGEGSDLSFRVWVQLLRTRQGLKPWKLKP